VLRRARLIFFATLAVSAVLAPAVARADSTAGVVVRRCVTGDDAKHRLATFHAHMQSASGSARMAMRFKVVARFAGHKPQTLDNSQLNVWHRSNSGVTSFGYSQTVRGLGAGGSYRTVVRFHWYDAHGKIVRTARRESGECVQNGKLPNLFVSAIGIAPGSAAGTSVYRVSIGNNGKGTAENFSVAILVDGALADSKAVDRLEAGQTATLELNGPVCDQVRAVVDSDKTVTETAEDDNSRRRHC
jgi:hypothetical protein